jgi:hypothetical protein
MLQETIQEGVYKYEDVWRAEPWREINDLCKKFFKGQYKILFYNIEDCSKMPEVLKFVAFDWENLKVMIYREPEVKIYTYDSYNDLLGELKHNEPKLLNEGLKIDGETEYKRIFLFKDIGNHKVKQIKKGNQIIKVGDFLSTCWGYDQTNVELFTVKKIIGKNYLIIQEVAQQIENTGNEGATYDNVRVSDSIYKIDIPIKAYISNDGYMSVCEYGYKRGLSLTDMKQTHYKTNPQFGH